MRHALLQFPPATGDGFDTEARNNGELAVTAVAQPLRFQAGVQPTLAFIQGTEQDVHPGVKNFCGVDLGLLTIETLALMNASL